MSTPIVDSHVHLFPASHLPTLAWYRPGNPIGAQHSVDEYRHASSSVSTDASTHDPKYLRGFIFVEVDRISSVAEHDPPGWTHALDEVSLLTRIARGEPIPGEGHQPAHHSLCLGIVTWAPVPGGPKVLSAYMDKVKERTKTEDVWRRVCGVRYLTQNRPAGTMLAPAFVEGLRWLGTKGLAFELGVNARLGGLGQLRESVEMMQRVYSGVAKDSKEAVTIIINHFSKPNLRLPPASVPNHSDYLEWKDLTEKMAHAHPRTYMKLSGALTELPPLDAESEFDIPALVERLKPWTDAVFDAFGAERVMFGSDWPVCNTGGSGDVAWNRWRRIVEGILERRGLSEEQKKGVWGGVAVEAYGIQL
ncbi:hypothetical protein N7510_006080 [Penicillium lagena]|uniref:uncharacterized protein n=1 Tax=Penicillium lagena TaxID=94218 RepID=UPI00253F761F|nr:uncharacterized protein N7510_006080 [Penicillium lagena]KAJ5612886.1 hypothetical protein N7510_006080 [Penicillium lagena]